MWLCKMAQQTEDRLLKYSLYIGWMWCGVRFDVVRHGTAWHRVVRRGAAWCGVVRRGVASCRASWRSEKQVDQNGEQRDSKRDVRGVGLHHRVPC
jgi:hypothetical protein